MYRENRFYENMNVALFEGAGKYEMPYVEPVYELNAENWIGFNFAKQCKMEDRTKTGVHFWIDDYQFTRVWNDLNRSTEQLKSFGTVLGPDFSMYCDFPKVSQLWNCYRNHWLCAYWQVNGIQVIPSVLWGDRDSFEYCFDGLPQNSIVSVSSVGTQKSTFSQELFRDGYREMMDRLHPSQILFYGKVPDFCEGNIIEMPTTIQQIRKRNGR